MFAGADSAPTNVWTLIEDRNARISYLFDNMENVLEGVYFIPSEMKFMESTYFNVFFAFFSRM